MRLRTREKKRKNRVKDEANANWGGVDQCKKQFVQNTTSEMGGQPRTQQREIGNLGSLPGEEKSKKTRKKSQEKKPSTDDP